MNEVQLIGRLAADPRGSVTTAGTTTSNFRIAVDRPMSANGEKGVDFINICAFGKIAESVNQYLEKGRQVAVLGSLRVKEYMAQDGMKRWSTEVQARSVQFLGQRPKERDAEEAEEELPF